MYAKLEQYVRNITEHTPHPKWTLMDLRDDLINGTLGATINGEVGPALFVNTHPVATELVRDLITEQIERIDRPLPINENLLAHVDTVSSALVDLLTYVQFSTPSLNTLPNPLNYDLPCDAFCDQLITAAPTYYAIFNDRANLILKLCELPNTSQTFSWCASWICGIIATTAQQTQQHTDPNLTALIHTTRTVCALTEEEREIEERELLLFATNFHQLTHYQ